MNRPRTPTRSPRPMIALLAVCLALFASPPALSTQLPNVLAANEAAAIAELRRIAAAQSEFKQALDIDTNCDGDGEYGYFGDMAGTVPMRVAIAPPGYCYPTSGVWGVNELTPPILRHEFGMVLAGSAVHQGYVFQMWLAGPEVFGKVRGIGEDWFGGILAPPFPDPEKSAHYWCCYAWPLACGQTGRAAFFINQRGQVLRWSNRSTTPFTGLPFIGMSNTPGFDEAFTVADDMSSQIRVGIPGGAAGSRWLVVP